MAYTDPSTLTFAALENPLASAKLNTATNDQLLALFPDGIAGVSWTPGLGGTLGGAAVTTVGRRKRVAGIQHLWADFDITSDGAGFYFVTLPVPAVGLTFSAEHGRGQVVGQWTLRDDSVPSSRNGSVLLRAADEVWFNVGPGRLSAEFPFDIAPGDSLSMYVAYPYI